MTATRGLSRVQFWTCAAIVIAIFFFWNGPVWRHPFDVDASAFASYAPIPLLVAGCLLWSRRLSARWLLLDTIALTAVKFSITYAAATLLWMASDPPEHPGRPQPEYAAPSPLPPQPPPTELGRGETGAVEGVVTAGGAPVAGMLVYIDGLDDYVFAAPSEPVRLELSGAGVRPAVAAVQTYQPLRITSTDGVLHTVVATDAQGERVFNRAAPGDGTPADVVLTAPAGVTTVRCRVHEASAPESPGTLGVFAHPFFAVTGADGRFHFDGVPNGIVTVVADRSRREVVLGERGSARVELAIE